jgi:DNA invertase Pin-like site-specific DNA recombinase
MMASVLASFAQYERRLISQRTKDALAVKRSQGVKLGRRPTLDPAVRTRIRRLRSLGWSFAKIAATLNAEGVATAHGGAQWHPSTVRAAANALRPGD